jgi:peptidoglycan lytic transglycosylase
MVRSKVLRVCAILGVAALMLHPGVLAAEPIVVAQAPAAAALAVPKPVASASEAEHTSRLNAALAPLRALAPTAETAASLREALKAVGAGNAAKAAEIRAQIADPVARKIVDWARLKGGYGDLAEYKAFLEQNPAWPDRGSIAQRLEEALFSGGTPPAAIKAHFRGAEPKTGTGMAALASAKLAEGDIAGAKALAAKAWREEEIPARLEAAFLQRFGPHLTQADHKWRLDRLLMDDIRWEGERNERAAVAKRVIPLLAAPEQKKAQARLAVLQRAANAGKLLGALPAEAGGDWGVTFHRIQLLRRANKTDEAAKLLLGAPTDPAKIVNPDGWWIERRAVAYDALNAGKAKLAYELVREAGPLTVNSAKEQAFMAGWLALRELEDARAAESHFKAVRQAADGPLSRAKADYWLGRTAEARGDRTGAMQFYRAATREADTFHGQLAAQKIEPGRRRLDLRPPSAPTSDEVAKFNAFDAVKAAVIAQKAGLGVPVLRTFLNNLRTVMRSEGEVALAAHLAETLGDMQSAVRIGKLAVARGQNLHYYAYPVHPFPAYSALRKPPEPAFLLGIARQESEFNTLTVSGAGARGLLQVMPITARHVCRDYKVTCDIPRLLSDQAYNTMIASAYIADRMDEFAGSYVLTLAGYNAGPGRARQWIRAFGDPRDPNVDPIDWIERIPFQETREYVAKVLSNIQVYRARLGDEAAALRLDQDLVRARLSSRGASTAGEPASASAPRGG